MTKPQHLAIDETGKRYGLLVVLRKAERRSASGGVFWVCRCACGSAEREVRATDLRAGTKSCGCLRYANNRGNTTHGMTGQPGHNSYVAAKARCNSPSAFRYKDYGGRGIKFKLPSFEKFWAVMGPLWFAGATLERKNNDGHYTMRNIRWATRKEQQENTRRSRHITFRGETKNLATWALQIGISEGSLHKRLRLWPLKRALTEPPNR